MKKRFKSMIAMFLALVLFTSVRVNTLAFDMLAPDGQTYIILGGRLKDINNNKHTLNGVRCRTEFTSSQQGALYMAIFHAVQDWNWHLGLINQSKGTDYSISLGAFTREQSEICFNYQEGYITVNNQSFSSAYGLTQFFDILDRDISDKVAKGESWRRTNITFSMQKFNDYANNHGREKMEEIMQRAANHEIGHAFGLAHDSRDNGIIMYGANNEGVCKGFVYDFDDMTAEVPTLHDLMAVYYLYG